jgi:hypothetical protein
MRLHVSGVTTQDEEQASKRSDVTNPETLTIIALSSSAVRAFALTYQQIMGLIRGTDFRERRYAVPDACVLIVFYRIYQSTSGNIRHVAFPYPVCIDTPLYAANSVFNAV